MIIIIQKVITAKMPNEIKGKNADNISYAKHNSSVRSNKHWNDNYEKIITLIRILITNMVIATIFLISVSVIALLLLVLSLPYSFSLLS